jgi:hypothetical protein
METELLEKEQIAKEVFFPSQKKINPNHLLD